MNYQQIWDKLAHGLKKYCTDNHFEKVTLGLSGGLDSAVTAVLAADVLGGANVQAVMMKTKNTSSLSLQIAREIARLNHLDFTETDIQPLVDAEDAFLSTITGGRLKNIVLENIQARQRGLLLMALSNQNNSLVLACSNKSETAMGYCTLYGDTCGGLAPIGNLYKSAVFELAKWRNTRGLVLPTEVIVRAPSAELSAGQKDEDSLPPYKVLDRILEAYLDQRESAAAIVAEGFDAVTVEGVIRRFHAQEFKRRQLPPSLPL